MKIVNVDFGAEKLGISVPDEATIATFINPDPHPKPNDAVQKAIDFPYGAPALKSLLRPGLKVAIAHDDPTKPSAPFQCVLNVIIDNLLEGGVRKKDIKFISANGNHKKWTDDELLNFLGRRIFDTFHPLGNITNHDCVKKEGLLYLGKTPGGAIIDHNQNFLDADLLIYAGQVVAHSWGGYTGTGAAIGLASTQSIASHHNYRVVNHPDSTIGDQKQMYFRKLKAEINFGIEKSIGKRIFYVNWVGGIGGKIVDVFAGYSPELEEPSWQLADKFSIIDVPQADILVLGLPQSYAYGSANNPLIAAIGMAYPPRVWLKNHLLKKGGCIIGLNPSTGVFDEDTYPSTSEVIKLRSTVSSIQEMSAFQKEVSENEHYLERYSNHNAYHPIHPFWLLNSCDYMMTRASEVFLVGTTNEKIFRSIGITPTKDFDTALKQAQTRLSADPKIVVVPSYWSQRPFKFRVKI